MLRSAAPAPGGIAAGTGPLPAGPVEFRKYTLAGNTFLIVDERRTPLSGDRERGGFARWALDPHFGVGGADNVIYLNGWAPGEFGFRIFEVDGAETLFCGNALLCAADLLSRTEPDRPGTRGGVPGAAGPVWTLWTEQPTGHPRPVRAGPRPGGGAFVAAGLPRPIPQHLYRRAPGGPAPSSAEQIRLRAEIGGRAMEVSGWLTFTGEPHLVLVLGHGLPETLRPLFFPGPADDGRSDLLMDRLGWSVNHQKTLFPHGVHVNVADPADGPAIDYRTWERAINRETLACGSGALACVHVCGGSDGPEARAARPYRCRRHRPDTELAVADGPDGPVLIGHPRAVCTGLVPPGAA